MEIIYYILIALLFGEFSLALVFYPALRGDIYYKLRGKSIFVYDRKYGYHLRKMMCYSNPTVPLPNAPRRIMNVDIRTDKYGFLCTEDIDELKNNNKLIFCIGGSTTMASESRHDKSYPAFLDLLTREYGYAVINAGVGGYRSIHELQHLKAHILPHKPWGIIIFSGANDFEDYGYGMSAPYNPFVHCISELAKNKIQSFFRRSALVNVTLSIINILGHKIRTESIDINRFQRLNAALTTEVSNWLTEFDVNLTEMVNICKANGINCYILDHASPVYKNAPEEAKQFADKDLNMSGRFDTFVKYIGIINTVTASICKKAKITFLDVSRDFDRYCQSKDGTQDYKKRFALFIDRMHFTEDGNSLLAKAIFDRIKEDLC